MTFVKILFLIKGKIKKKGKNHKTFLSHRGGKTALTGHAWHRIHDSDNSAHEQLLMGKMASRWQQGRLEDAS